MGASPKDFVEELRDDIVFFFPMKRLRIVAASALLVMWVPATSFCLAENAGVIAKSDGCGDCPASEASPCCAMASAAYKLDDNASVVVPSSGNSLFCITVELYPPRGVSLVSNPCESPPEIRSSWQFFARAAARPRAPSLAL
jgi:hypothetical protein